MENDEASAIGEISVQEEARKGFSILNGLIGIKNKLAQSRPLGRQAVDL